MKRIVFILGAGASADSGAPLMKDFLYEASGVSADPEYRDAFDLVFKARAELQVAQSKARFDIHNLEAVFAAFEMAELMGYSWPKTDQFFHQLFALGSIGTTILRRFRVLDPDPAVAVRFRDELLGEQARACFVPDFEGPRSQLLFRDSIGLVARDFGIPLAPTTRRNDPLRAG